MSHQLTITDILMQTLTIANKKFSLELLEETLKRERPGRYKIVVHTSHAVWECKVRWTGEDFYDIN